MYLNQKGLRFELFDVLIFENIYVQFLYSVFGLSMLSIGCFIIYKNLTDWKNTKYPELYILFSTFVSNLYVLYNKDNRYSEKRIKKFYIQFFVYLALNLVVYSISLYGAITFIMIHLLGYKDNLYLDYVSFVFFILFIVLLTKILSISFIHVKLYKIKNHYTNIVSSLFYDMFMYLLILLLLLSIRLFSGFSIPMLEFIPMLVFALFLAILINPITPHFWVRLVLFYKGVAPLRYRTFLNRVAKTGIMGKSDGHWYFRHQLIRDYFLPEQREALVIAFLAIVKQRMELLKQKNEDFLKSKR